MFRQQIRAKNGGNDYEKRNECWLHHFYAADLTMVVDVCKVSPSLYAIVPIRSSGGRDDDHVIRGQRDLQIIITAISAL